MAMALTLPPVVGHRGAALHAPENSLAGFDKAAELGARWVEFDVMLSADGVPVVHHDLTLERTAGRCDAVADLTAEGLVEVDVGGRFAPQYAGQKLPTLAQVIDRLSRLNLGANVEIKPSPGRDTETSRAVLAVLQSRWPRHLPPPLISSFSQGALAVAAAAAPALPRGWLADRLPSDWKVRAESCGCVSLHLGWQQLKQSQAAAVKSAGYALAVWTVNDPQVARRCRAWGADAIITDTPAVILASIGEAAANPPLSGAAAGTTQDTEARTVRMI